MAFNPTSEQDSSLSAGSALYDFKESHKEELAAITEVLAKITHRTPAQVKSHLETMIEQLVSDENRPFYETATPEERARAFVAWASSHAPNTSLLSEEAISRQSIYDYL